MSEWTVEMRTHGLFPVPVWEVRVGELAGQRAKLIEEALRFLADHPQPVGRFEQSTTGLAEVSEPWRLVEAGFTNLAQHLLDQHFHLPTHRRITSATSWVLKVDGNAHFSEQTGVELFHSHRASVISSVYYLRVPAEVDGTPEGGTLFRDPASALRRDLAAPVNVPLPGTTGTMVFFPSWLEHMTNPPGVARYSEPRIIIGTDYFIG